MAYTLYLAFIDQKIPPGIYMGLRTPNDRIPAGERAFMTACIRKGYTEGDTPVKIKNFSKKKEES